MLTTLWPFITITLVALLMGTTLAHALEMPAKMRAPAELWLTFQHTLYVSFATIGGPIEILAIVSTTVLLFLQRDDPTAFAATAIAAALLAMAFFVVWIFFTNAVNKRTAVWRVETIPPGWSHWRTQWEYSHLTRFVLHLCAFVALLAVLCRAKMPG